MLFHIFKRMHSLILYLFVYFADYEQIVRVCHWGQERSRKQHQSLFVIQQVFCKGKLALSLFYHHSDFLRLLQMINTEHHFPPTTESQVPIDPEFPNAKRNFWRVDESSITPKMQRRHFSDMAELFPGLPTTWDRKPAPPPAPSSPVCPVKMEKMEGRPNKFTGPFSIESLLKKDHLPQVRVTMHQEALTAPNTNLCFSDQFQGRTASTDLLTCLDQMNRQHTLYYMYRSVEEASWGKPVQRMAGSPELHDALLYSPHFP